MWAYATPAGSGAEIDGSSRSSSTAASARPPSRGASASWRTGDAADPYADTHEDSPTTSHEFHKVGDQWHHVGSYTHMKSDRNASEAVRSGGRGAVSPQLNTYFNKFAAKPGSEQYFYNSGVTIASRRTGR